MRICSHSERTSEILSHCPASNQTMKQWLHSLTIQQLWRLTEHWVVDEKHKVLGCLHFKVSTATWDVILCNNSMPTPLKPDHQMHWQKWKQCLPDNNVYFLGADNRYRKQQIIDRIMTYYKFIVVRHPLDRLSSIWKDKLGDQNEWYPEHMGSKILSLYRRSLSRKEIKAGKGVYFNEFIQYILDGYKDEHWRGPYNDQCMPCIVNYDSIIKLETFSHDVVPLVSSKLEGRSSNTMVNSFSKASWDKNFHKYLPSYVNVTNRQLERIVDKYKLDFHQFGYRYDFKNGKMDLSCNSTQGCC